MEGRVIAEAQAFRSIDQDKGLLGALSHTASLVEVQAVRLVQLPGKANFQLHVVPPGGAEAQALQLDEEWELLPGDVEKVGPRVHTQKAPGDSTVDVALTGELEGEDLPLYDFELKRKGHFFERLLSPNTPLPSDLVHRPSNEPRKLILGWEDRKTAQEWYALVALCLGRMTSDHPSLEQLPVARSHSSKLLAGAQEGQAAAV